MAPMCVRAVHVGLVLLLVGRVLPSASGCSSVFYERAINDVCMAKFKLDMAALERSLWCSWTDTLEPYEGLTNCTFQVASRLDCFWPNQALDRLFTRVHRVYFNDCALTGRLLHDPPLAILCPLIAVPVLVTLLVTALVVWRSKCSEAVL